MTFPEVFESLKSHRYLRRKSWSPKLFINLRHTVPLIRLVMFTEDKYDIKTIKILSNDIRFYVQMIYLQMIGKYLMIYEKF